MSERLYGRERERFNASGAWARAYGGQYCRTVCLSPACHSIYEAYLCAGKAGCRKCTFCGSLQVLLKALKKFPSVTNWICK